MQMTDCGPQRHVNGSSRSGREGEDSQSREVVTGRLTRDSEVVGRVQRWREGVKKPRLRVTLLEGDGTRMGVGIVQGSSDRPIGGCVREARVQGHDDHD
eukprot:1234259-Rhodomonas_salina.1